MTKRLKLIRECVRGGSSLTNEGAIVLIEEIDRLESAIAKTERMWREERDRNRGEEEGTEI